jgi:hypothetical protein
MQLSRQQQQQQQQQPPNHASHLVPTTGDLQRLFARVAWRMRGGWAGDVPFIEKLPVVEADCKAVLENSETGGGGGGAIVAHGSWGGCEDSEPDMECVGLCFAPANAV